MSDFGLSSTGFNKKRAENVIAEQSAAYKNSFGDNFTLDDSTPFGVLAGLQSGTFADLWDIAEISFTMFSPDNASGILLDFLCEYNGIFRKEATRSKVNLLVGGTDGTLIPAGSKVKVTDTEEVFITIQDVTIQSGSVIAPAQSEKTGVIVAGANTITTVVTSISGWNTVDNSEAASEGFTVESDEDLRIRRKRSTGINATNTVDSVYSLVSDLDGTSDVRVLENDSNATDGNSLPAHSSEVIVVGGDELEIATAMRSKKTTGIGFNSNGGVARNVQVLDAQGFLQTVTFTRPDDIAMDVEVTITATSGFPGDGEGLIKQAIVDYANGELVTGRGFSTNDNVILSELYTPVNSVQGHSVSSIQIAKHSQSLGDVDIVIALREISSFSIGNITVVQ